MARAYASGFFVLALAGAACAAPPVGEPGGPPPSAEPPSPPPVAAASSSGAPGLAASAVPPSPPLLGRDHRSTVACTADADCGWDDGCFPKRCVEAKPRVACDESGPPPGACLCVGGACTTRPTRPVASTSPCEPRGCVVDRAAGACVADTLGVAESIRTNPGVSVGPSCDCVTPAEGCVFSWFEPIACKSERDCWVEAAPRRHPVRRPAALRGRAFKPCTDGEVAPVCTSEGFCALGPAYKC